MTQLATESPQPQAQIVIDCHNIEEVTASGLSALLEFRASFEALRWALVCLTPAMLAAALELRLAERFMICRDAEAARAALQDDAA